VGNDTERRAAARKADGRYRTGAKQARGVVVGEGNTQINNHFDESRRSNRWGSLIFAALALLVASGAVMWLQLRGDDDPASPTGEAVSTSRPGPAAGDTPATPSSTWYDLAALRPIAKNLGFFLVDPVRIGTETFPASIVGTQPSNVAGPMNKGTWPLGGQCSEFSVSIGKRMDSAGAGTGRFVVTGDDRELFSAELGPNDPAMPVTIDVTGVLRLTLLDVRQSADAENAWGRPRVLCTSAPAPPR